MLGSPYPSAGGKPSSSTFRTVDRSSTLTMTGPLLGSMEEKHEQKLRSEVKKVKDYLGLGNLKASVSGVCRW